MAEINVPLKNPKDLCVCVCVFMCMYLHIYMCSTCMQCPWRPEGILDPLELGMALSHHGGGGWNLNLDPLQEQHVPLTAEQTL